MALSRTLGFSDDDQGRMGIALTELCTNMIKHAGGGEILIAASHAPGGGAVELLALDRGPGIRDLARCLVDGYSTAGTPGTGLGAIQRQSTQLDVYTAPGLGTALHARIGKSKTAAPATADPRWSAVIRPMPGEQACGDAVSVREEAGKFVALVADGLGHGVFAAQASAEAQRLFEKSATLDPDALAETVHLGLKPTRGAAIAVAAVDFQSGIVTFSGIGNIAGVLAQPGRSKKLVSNNGTAGHIARRIHGFQYPLDGAQLLIMHSDGIGTAWSLDKYPGLAQRTPMLIAGILYRDFGKTRDDAAVLVARLAQ
jgi:anti-sigma regulatory factor (Ser/Thr protein kinase)